MNRILLLVLAASTLGAASAGETPAGVYRGTIGTLPIVACFDGSDGVYYYLKRKIDIELRKEDGAWVETTHADYGIKDTARLTLQPSGDALTGRWQALDGKRTLPIALNRIGTPVGMCSADETYNAPRVATVAWTAGKTVTIGGRKAKIFTAFAGNMTTMLPEQASNGLTARLLHRRSEMVAEYFGCTMDPKTNDYMASDRITQWNESFLVLRKNYDYFCGGAYPDAGFTVEILDAASGKKLSLRDWLAEPLTPAKMLSYYHPDQEDCALEEDYYGEDAQIWPEKDGIHVLPVLPHVIRACGGDVVIPWKDVRLNGEGRKRLAALQAEK